MKVLVKFTSVVLIQHMYDAELISDPTDYK